MEHKTIKYCPMDNCDWRAGPIHHMHEPAPKADDHLLLYSSLVEHLREVHDAKYPGEDEVTVAHDS